MKAKDWKGHQCCYAHQKYDGINIRISRNGVKLQALTRTPHDIADELKSCGWMFQVFQKLPTDVIVHGELYLPGHKASMVKSALASNPNDLRFGAFAIEADDVDPSLKLAETNMRLSSWGFQTIPYMVHSSLRMEGLGGIGWFDWPEDLLEALPANVEGYVMKNGNMWDWYKLKPVKTIDVIVRGFKEGKNSFLGLTGSLRVETAEGVEVACVSGMDLETRLDVSEDEPAHLNRVCEVRYQYVGDKGRLRHPAFVRWREDKPADECTLDQDEELLDYWRSYVDTVND